MRYIAGCSIREMYRKEEYMCPLSERLKKDWGIEYPWHTID